MKTLAPFIAVEGSDGTGKSTFCEKLKRALIDRHHDTQIVRQPGGTLMAEELRGIFKAKYKGEEVTPLAEYLILSAARKQLDYNVIEKALLANTIVISDRHLLSTHAYQGRAINEIDKLVARPPLVTVLLEASLEACNERLTAKGEDCRVEAKGEDYFKDVHNRYSELISNPFNGRVFRVDTTDFDSDVCKEGMEMAIQQTIELIEGVQLGLDFELDYRDNQVTVKELEKQIFTREGIRVIHRCDSSIKVNPYPDVSMDEHTSLDEFERSLRALNPGVPFVVATLDRDVSQSSQLWEIRAPHY